VSSEIFTCAGGLKLFPYLAVGSKFAFGSFGALAGGKKVLVSSEILFTYAGGGLIIP